MFQPVDRVITASEHVVKGRSLFKKKMAGGTVDEDFYLYGDQGKFESSK